MSRCGKCQQFIRTSGNRKDVCGAWEQPTIATREACEFFLPKKHQLKKSKQNSLS